jgi:diacylglycerol kinase (ATP)
MIAIVVNETAGHGKAARQYKKVEAFLKQAQLPYRIYKTNQAGHARTLARQAAQEGIQTVFAMGGDGLAQEVARGIYGSETAMGILPAGTGNDFVKALGLPQDPVAALKHALACTPRKIDVGLINGEVFLNVAGTGFDIQTLLWAQKFKTLGSGMLPYLLGAICAIVTFKPIELEMRFDDESVHQAVTIVTIANGQFLGGGMHVAPKASVSDGLFDILLVDPIAKPLIPFLLPHFIRGTAEKLAPAHVRRCKRVTLRRKGQVMDVDGELVSVDDVTLQIVPQGLWMRC